MSSRWLPSLAALLVLTPSTMADAAILIEARQQRDALRIVVEAEQQRALIATPRGQSLIDLGAIAFTCTALGASGRCRSDLTAPQRWAGTGSRRGGRAP